MIKFLIIIAIGAIVFLNNFMADFLIRDEINELCSSEYGTTSFLLSDGYRRCLIYEDAQRALVRRKIKENEKQRVAVLERIPQLQVRMMETVELIGQDKFYSIDQKLFNSFGTNINIDNLGEKNSSAAAADGGQLPSGNIFPDGNRIAELFDSGQIPSRLLRVTMQRCMFTSSYRSADYYDSAGFGCLDTKGYLHSFDGSRFDRDLELFYLYGNTRIPIDLFIEVQIDQVAPGMNMAHYEVMGMIVQPEMFLQYFEEELSRLERIMVF